MTLIGALDMDDDDPLLSLIYDWSPDDDDDGFGSLVLDWWSP